MACEHFNHLGQVPSSPASYRRGCPECLALGDTWVHLRECLVCGNVGCCDSSKNKHSTRHFKASTHPVMRSVEPGEAWGWCFVHEATVDLAGTALVS